MLSVSKKDSAQKETLVVSATIRTNVENQRAHLLLLQNRERKAMENFFEKKASQRPGSVWEETSKTVQRLHPWEMLVCFLASSRMSELQTESGCKFGRKMFVYAQTG